MKRQREFRDSCWAHDKKERQTEFISPSLPSCTPQSPENKVVCVCERAATLNTVRLQSLVKKSTALF